MRVYRTGAGAPFHVAKWTTTKRTHNGTFQISRKNEQKQRERKSAMEGYEPMAGERNNLGNHSIGISEVGVGPKGSAFL